jgi:hypothetical protein
MGKQSAAALRRPVKFKYNKKNAITINADKEKPLHKDPKFCRCGAVALFKVGMKGFCYEHKAEAYASAKAEPGREMFLPE